MAFGRKLKAVDGWMRVGTKAVVQPAFSVSRKQSWTPVGPVFHDVWGLRWTGKVWQEKHLLFLLLQQTLFLQTLDWRHYLRVAPVGFLERGCAMWPSQP